MKINKELVKQVQNGTAVIKNDGSLQELRTVIKECFPKHQFIPEGTLNFYGRNAVFPERCAFVDKTGKKEISVRDFFVEKRKIIGYELAKPEYEEAILKIAGTKKLRNLNGCNFEIHSIMEDKIREAGVLELWCRPVYEQKSHENSKKIQIELKDGRWLVNGKRLEDMSYVEQNFLENFFREAKEKTKI